MLVSIDPGKRAGKRALFLAQAIARASERLFSDQQGLARDQPFLAGNDFVLHGQAADMSGPKAATTSGRSDLRRPAQPTFSSGYSSRNTMISFVLVMPWQASAMAALTFATIFRFASRLPSCGTLIEKTGLVGRWDSIGDLDRNEHLEEAEGAGLRRHHADGAAAF
jgi:hypothetical protein